MRFAAAFAYLVLALCPLSYATPTAFSAKVDVISGQPHDGPSTVQFTSGASGWDGPMVKNLNSSTFDLWYFDVLSADTRANVVFVFFTATVDALFPGLPDLGTATWLWALITWPDGDVFQTLVPADHLTVTTNGAGSSGAFPDGIAAWQGTADLSSYTLTFSSPDVGFTGTVTMKSAAPAHFPCAATSAGAGQTLNLGPTLGWFNAVPDSTAHVDLDVNGTKAQFSGRGYHDKNWGSVPEKDTLLSWYWGHANVGPYSVVWFDYINVDGTEGVSGYVAQNGKVLASTCSGVSVRPLGAPYPPTPTTSLPYGFNVSIDVPGQGTFTIEALNRMIVTQGDGLSTRWAGSVDGGFAGQTRYFGNGFYEQFTF